MKANLNKLSKQYLAALRKHLKPGLGTGLEPAIKLGRQAVALGLETLDLARIHAQTLTALVLPGGSPASRERMIKRAKAFFLEAIAPIEHTHRAALEADVRVDQLNRTLRQRTVESSASTRHLKQGIVQRHASDQALKRSGKQRADLLAESRRLREHLRHLTHEILSAQEEERHRISHQLHDEIAQTLLGINVRLLALKNIAKASTKGLKKEIASTQRLVKQSLKTIDRFAHEFGFHHET